MDNKRLSDGWLESGWGGRTRRDSHRRNPVSRFIAEGDYGSSQVLDTSEEIQRTLSLGLLDESSLPVDSSAPSLNTSSPAGKGKRLVSLDVLRGLAVVLMIFVDNLGGTWPELYFSAWEGLRLADIISPLFLFVAGVSIPISLRRQLEAEASIGEIWKKLIVRALKLFLLGILLQGGGLPGPCADGDETQLCVGYNLKSIRVPGILQRIAFGYLFVALVTLSSMLTAEPVMKRLERKVEDSWDPAKFAQEASNEAKLRGLLGNREVGSTIGVGMDSSTGDNGPTCCQRICTMLQSYRRFVLLWVVTAIVVIVYVLLTTFTAVGDYKNPSNQQVSCIDGGRVVRGARNPACNAVGYYDRLILGEEHMLKINATFSDLPECQVADPPAWCSVPFDPQGIVSSIGSVVTVFFGAYYGQILLSASGQSAMQIRQRDWLPLSLSLAAAGIILHVTGAVPLNMKLYSISYLLLTGGISSASFALLHAVVDSSSSSVAIDGRSTICGKIVSPLAWLGSNSILFYIMHTLHAHILRVFYVGATTNNLYDGQAVLFAHLTRVDDCDASRICVLWLTCMRCVAWVVLAAALRSLNVRWTI